MLFSTVEDSLEAARRALGKKVAESDGRVGEHGRSVSVGDLVGEGEEGRKGKCIRRNVEEVLRSLEVRNRGGKADASCLGSGVESKASVSSIIS